MHRKYPTLSYLFRRLGRFLRINFVLKTCTCRRQGAALVGIRQWRARDPSRTSCAPPGSSASSVSRWSLSRGPWLSSAAFTDFLFPYTPRDHLVVQKIVTSLVDFLKNGCWLTVLQGKSASMYHIILPISRPRSISRNVFRSGDKGMGGGWRSTLSVLHRTNTKSAAAAPLRAGPRTRGYREDRDARQRSSAMPYPYMSPDSKMYRPSCRFLENESLRTYQAYNRI